MYVHLCSQSFHRINVGALLESTVWVEGVKFSIIIMVGQFVVSAAVFHMIVWVGGSRDIMLPQCKLV